MDECGRPYGCLNPLARQLETYLTPSWIDRQLGGLSAVLGVLLIHLLECRKVLGVMAFIQRLECRYHFAS